jgi:methionyl aminopeptidase
MLSSILTPKVVSQPDADGHYNPFPSYPFTGPLRPVYPLSPKRTVPEKIRLPDYAHNGIPKSEQVRSPLYPCLSFRLTDVQVFVGRHKIKILNKEEQEGMRKVCRMTREVLDLAARMAKPGVTTDEIDKALHEACIERDVRIL